MTQAQREQLIEELKALETREFFINMKDYWSASDTEMLREIDNRQREIKALLN